MSKALVKSRSIEPPKTLSFIFKNPALAGEEKREQYDAFFLAIADELKPSSMILWMYVWDVAALSWEIYGQRLIKSQVVQLAQAEVVRELLCSLDTNLMRLDTEYRAETLESRQWATGGKSRKATEAKLLKNGYDASYIMAKAYIDKAANIDAVDRRVALSETRRTNFLREIDRHSGALKQQIENESTKVIEGEYSDASEP